MIDAVEHKSAAILMNKAIEDICKGSQVYPISNQHKNQGFLKSLDPASPRLKGGQLEPLQLIQTKK